MSLLPVLIVRRFPFRGNPGQGSCLEMSKFWIDDVTPCDRAAPPQIFRERERINALHDAIAIIAAELGSNDNATKEAIVARLRAEESKMTIEDRSDERGLKHPWPAELSSLCESIEYFARKRQ
jgi:hypothetical protein